MARFEIYINVNMIRTTSLVIAYVSYILMYFTLVAKNVTSSTFFF